MRESNTCARVQIGTGEIAVLFAFRTQVVCRKQKQQKYACKNGDL